MIGHQLVIDSQSDSFSVFLSEVSLSSKKDETRDETAQVAGATMGDSS